jgi:PAS domain S-box-containing protein
MLAWRLDGSIEFWNAGAERLYGFASDEAIGRSSHSLLQTKFPIEFAEVSARLRNDGYWSGELRHVCKDGREVFVDSRMQLLGDKTVLEANRDITERRQIEAALRENEERLRWLASIVDSSDDAIVSKNLDGVVTSWNRGAERVFGYAAEEAIGQPITIVIPKDRQDEERTILTRIRRGERIDHFETVRQRKDGSLIVVSLTVSPVKSANGKIVGASKIARDISGQKRSQEQIVTLAREAEHRSKNLLANVFATVKLSQSDTPEGLKQAIEGRIQALANVHSLVCPDTLDRRGAVDDRQTGTCSGRTSASISCSRKVEFCYGFCYATNLGASGMPVLVTVNSISIGTASSKTPTLPGLLGLTSTWAARAEAKTLLDISAAMTIFRR